VKRTYTIAQIYILITYIIHVTLSKQTATGDIYKLVSSEEKKIEKLYALLNESTIVQPQPQPQQAAPTSPLPSSSSSSSPLSSSQPTSASSQQSQPRDYIIREDKVLMQATENAVCVNTVTLMQATLPNLIIATEKVLGEKNYDAALQMVLDIGKMEAKLTPYPDNVIAQALKTKIRNYVQSMQPMLEQKVKEKMEAKILKILGDHFDELQSIIASKQTNEMRRVCSKIRTHVENSLKLHGDNAKFPAATEFLEKQEQMVKECELMALQADLDKLKLKILHQELSYFDLVEQIVRTMRLEYEKDWIPKLNYWTTIEYKHMFVTPEYEKSKINIRYVSEQFWFNIA